MSKAIKDCLSMARKVQIPQGDELTSTIKKIKAEIQEVAQERKNLLPIERPYAEPKLDKKIAELKSRLRDLNNAEKKWGLSQTFSQLSLEPLGWRDAKGWPKLVLFSTDSPIFKLAVHPEWYYSGRGDQRRKFTKISGPKLPPILQACYNDVLTKLHAMATKEGKQVTLSTAFSGMIPAETREIIASAKKQFKEVFIIAEPNGWELKATTVPRPLKRPDPLVTGFDGDALWLVQRFNLTKLENYVASEFRV